MVDRARESDPVHVVDRAREAGVGVFAFGDGIRAVTHRDVSADQCREAASILVAISMVLTFVAGLIPSSAASRKDPVEALRSE